MDMAVPIRQETNDDDQPTNDVGEDEVERFASILVAQIAFISRAVSNTIYSLLILLYHLKAYFIRNNVF